MARTILPRLLLLAALPLAASAAEPDRQDLEPLRGTAAQLAGELKTKLQETIKSDGVAAAITVCSDIAPAIAGRLSRETGWQVSRVGTRVRNPLLGMPDAWEQRVLDRFEQRIAAGEDPATMEFHEVVSEPDGRFLRYMKPLTVQPPCLSWHGPAEGIPEEVRAALDQRYPHDEAIGYALGDLRGAVTIKRPLEH